MSAPPMSFDRASGRLQGASAMERCAALAFAAGARCSAPMHYRGFSLGARAIMSVLDQREIVVMLNDDARFAFPFGDGYWSLLLDRRFVYEGEIEQFLKSVAGVDYTFVDGGANFGFWSVLASSRPLGSHPVVAIEASTRNAAKLTRNAELNSNRFRILHRAVGSTSGNKVWLGGAKHEAFRVEEANGGAGESVEMISLDGLLDQNHVKAGQRFIVKLDVEGMETDAVKGGQKFLQNECVLILEDHGADREHTVSRYVMQNTPCRVYIFDESSGRYVAITELSMLDRIKTSTNFGYNVFATNSTFWEDKIKSIPPSTRH